MRAYPPHESGPRRSHCPPECLDTFISKAKPQRGGGERTKSMFQLVCADVSHHPETIVIPILPKNRKATIVGARRRQGEEFPSQILHGVLFINNNDRNVTTCLVED